MKRPAVEVKEKRAAPLRLYVHDEKDESRKALRLVDEIKALGLPIDVEYLNGDDGLTPWLVTPLSSFRGIEEIETFVKQERVLPVTKKHLEQ